MSCRRSGRGIFILRLFVMDEQFRDLLMLFRAPVQHRQSLISHCSNCPLSIRDILMLICGIGRLREILIAIGSLKCN